VLFRLGDWVVQMAETTVTGAERCTLRENCIICVRDLVKRFGQIVAVNGVCFDVQPAEIFAFLGPNGAGKTTTIKMLTTLLHPTSGSIMLNGFDPTKQQNQARASFGIVFQDPSLDEQLTAWENLELHGALYKVPRKLRRERIEELLKYVELWDRRGDLIKTFSGGMRRRLEIARGLMHHPKIFFLDEPTLGLDPQTRYHIWSYIQNLNRTEGITVFFTTHDMEEADRFAQRIAIIDHGKIVTTGTPAELKTRTNSETLEDAFLKLTGYALREEEAGSAESLRLHSRMWRR
jgi:ABC-2 type transport system ATP-binding protein